MIFFNINAVLNVYWSSLTNDLWLIIQLYIVNITVILPSPLIGFFYIVDVNDNTMVCVVKQ